MCKRTHNTQAAAATHLMERAVKSGSSAMTGTRPTMSQYDGAGATMRANRPEAEVAKEGGSTPMTRMKPYFSPMEPQNTTWCSAVQ